MCRLEVRASFLPPNCLPVHFQAFLFMLCNYPPLSLVGPFVAAIVPVVPLLPSRAQPQRTQLSGAERAPRFFFTAGAALLYEGSSRARAAREKNRCSHKNGSEILPTVPPAGTIWGALPAKIVPEPSHRSVRSVRSVPQRNSGSSSWLQSNLCQTSSFLHWRWRGRTQRTIYQPQ